MVEFIVVFLAAFLGAAAAYQIPRNRSKKKPKWQMGVTKSAWER